MKNPGSSPFDDGHLTIPEWDRILVLARAQPGQEQLTAEDEELLRKAQARIDRINAEVLKSSHPDARR